MVYRFIIELWNDLKTRFWIFAFLTAYFTACHMPEIVSSKSSFFWIGIVIPAIFLGMAIWTLYKQQSQSQDK